MSHTQITNFLWDIANLIRDVYKRGKYQDVILPLAVLRRIDAVLEPTKDAVIARQRFVGAHGIRNVDEQLRRASGFAFYNTSPYTFQRLLEDPPNLAANLRAYIGAFSANMRSVLEKFEFDATITRLDENNLLYLVMQRFAQADLHPDSVSNYEMGLIFEELIRRFNEALNENPGEHYTPRDVVQLMVGLLLSGDEEMLAQRGVVRRVYDPCCGSGGMLTITKAQIEAHNPQAQVALFGQEVNPETWAMCKSDLYIKSADGSDAEQIMLGSTLSEDHLAHQRFDYLITNPPYGHDWRKDERAVRAEADRGHAGRFGAGTPRISDGQMLFLQHLLARMKPVADGGSRVAIVMNGSPLFTGDAGSGESEIRRWILENDWLDTLVALPEQLFYNTGIATYVWVLTNRKPTDRKGLVRLINATDLWEPMRKSLGDKRRELTEAQLDEVLALYRGEKDGNRVRIYPTTYFGFRKITVERPLRLNFQASPERLARLDEQRTFGRLAESRKKGPAKQREEQEGRALQDAIRQALAALPGEIYRDRRQFERVLAAALRKAQLKLNKPVRDAIIAALSERDPEAAICRDADGRPEADPDLRDYENVPLAEDVRDYFAREVAPHVPDAWIDETVTDPRDREVGRVGYEINFNRYFYRYEPPRPLAEIEGEIEQLVEEIEALLRGMMPGDGASGNR